MTLSFVPPQVEIKKASVPPPSSNARGKKVKKGLDGRRRKETEDNNAEINWMVEDVNKMQLQQLNLEGSIAATQTDLEGSIAATKTDLEGSIAATKTDLEGSIAATRTDHSTSLM